MNQGNDEYNKDDFINATNFYTEGINVKCKDDELNAKLYSNRGTVQFLRGKHFFIHLLNFLFCPFTYSSFLGPYISWLVKFFHFMLLSIA